MKTDIIINYNELTKDKEVNILITEVPSSQLQLKVVEALIWVVNIYSPVKFNVTMEK